MRWSLPRPRHSPAESISGRRGLAALGLGAMAPSLAKAKASLLEDEETEPLPRALFPAAASPQSAVRGGLRQLAPQPPPPKALTRAPSPAASDAWNLSKSARDSASGNVPGLPRDQVQPRRQSWGAGRDAALGLFAFPLCFVTHGQERATFPASLRAGHCG